MPYVASIQPRRMCQSVGVENVTDRYEARYRQPTFKQTIDFPIK